MLTGLLFALLGAAIVAISIITMAKLFEIIEKKLKQHEGTQPVTGDLSKLLGGIIVDKLDSKQRVSLESLQKKLKKKPLYQASVNSKGEIEDIEIINSDKQDNDVEELLKENDGLIAWAV